MSTIPSTQPDQRILLADDEDASRVFLADNLAADGYLVDVAEDRDRRHLDLGIWRLEIRAQLRRLECPEHGVHVEGVPFARHRSGFTRDFEALAAWLATKTDKTTITRLVRVDWGTVGRIIARVCADELDRERLENLFEIGIDEVSWKRQHNYLTLVADHIRGQIVWGTEGNDSVAANRFFREIGKSRSHAIEVISLDMGPGYATAAREPAPQAVIAIDPYHVVAVANRALDDVRRAYWNELRRVGDRDAARRFKGARWSLLKAPQNLTEEQASTLRRLRRAGGESGAPTRSKKRCGRSSRRG